MRVGKVSRKEFSEVFKTGSRYASRFFTVVVKLSSRHTYKLAVVVPKKKVKKAVKRNILKRKMRALGRELLPSPPLSLPYGSYIFIYNGSFPAPSFGELQEDIERALVSIKKKGK